MTRPLGIRDASCFILCEKGLCHVAN